MLKYLENKMDNNFTDSYFPALNYFFLFGRGGGGRGTEFKEIYSELLIVWSTILTLHN